MQQDARQMQLEALRRASMRPGDQVDMALTPDGAGPDRFRALGSEGVRIGRAISLMSDPVRLSQLASMQTEPISSMAMARLNELGIVRQPASSQLDPAAGGAAIGPVVPDLGPLRGGD